MAADEFSTLFLNSHSFLETLNGVEIESKKQKDEMQHLEAGEILYFLLIRVFERACCDVSFLHYLPLATTCYPLLMLNLLSYCRRKFGSMAH